MYVYLINNVYLTNISVHVTLRITVNQIIIHVDVNKILLNVNRRITYVRVHVFLVLFVNHQRIHVHVILLNNVDHKYTLSVCVSNKDVLYKMILSIYVYVQTIMKDANHKYIHFVYA